MPNVSGSIETKSKDGKSIKVNGEWYGAFAPAMLGPFNKGDEVSFEYAETAGKGAYAGRTFKNIKGPVKMLNAGTPTATSTVISNNKPGDISIHTQRAIVRQNALTNAVNFVGIFDTSTPVSVEWVLEVAAKFEAYTSGDADLEAVKSELGIEE